MGKIIKVAVRNRIAATDTNTVYICGNSDFVIEFDFDEEWSAHEYKTARFTYDGMHQDVVFSGNTCPVPIISDRHSFKVGVFAGNLKTTTAAYVPAKKSILCDAGQPAPPTNDVYAQIMEKVNGYVSVNQGAENSGKLLYIGTDGQLVPLNLGDGLEIVDGVLRITAVITPETQIVFEDEGGGMVMMNSTEFVEQSDGEVLISGTSFTDQGNGVVLIE